MLLRNALFAVRLQHLAMRAAMQNEAALLDAIKGHAEFTVVSFQENGTILACICNNWVEA
jgi:hypothetical protein